MRDFYVDDFISGAESLDDIRSIRDEMINLSSRGGFTIRQWASNHDSALKGIDKRIFEVGLWSRGKSGAENFRNSLGLKVCLS